MSSATAKDHPHDLSGKAAKEADKKTAAKLAAIGRANWVRGLMRTEESRAQVYRLLGEGFWLPGQRINSSNGSLQAKDNGSREALQELCEDVHRYCPEQWLQMLDEAGHWDRGDQ